MSDAAPLPEIPGYRLLAVLGRGGMGEVYLAEDEALGRRVALKRITLGLSTGLHGEGARERFRREARTMARVSHPHLAQVHALREHAGSDYLVIELLEGGTLSDRIERSGTLAVPEALSILSQVGAGLAAAWRHRIVHRDIKPVNILFDHAGNPKVADFGLAKAVQGDPRVTVTGVVLGSPYYMSPEQAEDGEVGFASDIYSLGIVLYEMLTGSPPGLGDSYGSIINRHLAGTLPDLAAARPDIPPAVADLYRWMTRRDPAARPHSYAELLTAVDHLLGAEPAPAVRGSRPAVWWAGIALVALVVLVAAVVARAIVAGPGWEPSPVPTPAPAPSPAMPQTLQTPPAPPAPPPPPLAEAPEGARELTSLRTGAFGLRLEFASGPPPRFTARAGKPGHLTLFTLDGGGEIVLLHPAGATGSAAGEPYGPERPLLAESPQGSVPAWAFLVATTRPLPPPILLGARPEGSFVVYPHRVEGRAAVFPARDYLHWLVAKLRESPPGSDVSALALSPLSSSQERRNP
jgi:hypothetical protein